MLLQDPVVVKMKVLSVISLTQQFPFLENINYTVTQQCTEVKKLKMGGFCIREPQECGQTCVHLKD
jgi:hypothetical protein